MHLGVGLVAGCGLAALAGCASYEAQTGPLRQYPGIEQQITNFYDDNATEDDWNCTEVDLGAITRIKVVREDAGSITFATHYEFSPDEGLSSAGLECEGFSTRLFTFAKGGKGELSLESMSGPQRKPSA